MKHISKDKANKIYDLLVRIGKASEDQRNSFIHHFCVSEYGCDEWRFGGVLGFGGKYWRGTNRVSCYSEDETPKRLYIINELNLELELITA